MRGARSRIMLTIQHGALNMRLSPGHPRPRVLGDLLSSLHSSQKHNSPAVSFFDSDAGDRPFAGQKLGRIGWARLLVIENGLQWTAYAGLLKALKEAIRIVQGRMATLEQHRGLEGRNSVAVNYETWQRWDWSSQGEEWTPSLAWKQSVIDYVMLPHIKRDTTVLEIGPGAGRWTEALQAIARRLILIDLSDRCIDLCRERFEQADNIEFHVNDGKSLSAVPRDSVDGIWSFDVFVHVAPLDIEAYVGEIARVLRNGGRAVIHHPKSGREGDAVDFGQRSNVTAAMFAEMVRARGLTLVEQLESWGPDGQFGIATGWDTVSVIEK